MYCFWPTPQDPLTAGALPAGCCMLSHSSNPDLPTCCQLLQCGHEGLPGGVLADCCGQQGEHAGDRGRPTAASVLHNVSLQAQCAQTAIRCTDVDLRLDYMQGAAAAFYMGCCHCSIQVAGGLGRQQLHQPVLAACAATWAKQQTSGTATTCKCTVPADRLAQGNPG